MNVVLVADNILYNGVPTRLFQFDTEKSIEEVQEYYRGEWEEMTSTDFGQRRILSHREGDYLMTVQLELSEMAPSHGILAISPMFGLMERSPARLRKMLDSVGEGFPVLRDTSFISDIQANEIRGESRSLMFVNEHSIERNFNFYKEYFVGEDWKIFTDNSNVLNGASLAMTKSGTKLNLTFSKQGSQTFGVAVFLQ